MYCISHSTVPSFFFLLLFQSGKHPHKLLIIGTTSFKDDVLELTGISDAFNSSIEVPCLATGEDILSVLKDSNLYQFTSGEMAELEKRLKGKRWVC